MFHSLPTLILPVLAKQLKRSLDEGMVRLGKEGSRGVLFQLTLLKYGYTFVSKGTVAAFIEDLEHEAAVYHCKASVCPPSWGLLAFAILGGLIITICGFTSYTCQSSRGEETA